MNHILHQKKRKKKTQAHTKKKRKKRKIYLLGTCFFLFDLKWNWWFWLKIVVVFAKIKIIINEIRPIITTPILPPSIRLKLEATTDLFSKKKRSSKRQQTTTCQWRTKGGGSSFFFPHLPFLFFPHCLLHFCHFSHNAARCLQCEKTGLLYLP